MSTSDDGGTDEEAQEQRRQQLLRQLIVEQRHRHAQHIAHELHPWDHRPHTGTIERITEIFFAIHVGFGVYQLLELVRDLNGIVATAGALVHLAHDGSMVEAMGAEREPGRA